MVLNFDLNNSEGFKSLYLKTKEIDGNIFELMYYWILSNPKTNRINFETYRGIWKCSLKDNILTMELFRKEV